MTQKYCRFSCWLLYPFSRAQVWFIAGHPLEGGLNVSYVFGWTLGVVGT